MSAPTGSPDTGRHANEPHNDGVNARLNALRAAVLGANDGIVSVAGLVLGVAAASTSQRTILVAGMAGVISGALSMAAGEYVSVSTQRDTERAMIAQEIQELRDDPAGELEELAGIYRNKGLSPELAQRVAQELTDRDPLAAHLDAELALDPEDLTNPWHAAGASLLAFTLGALLPLLSILLVPDDLRVLTTMSVVTVALAGTGAISAYLGRAEKSRAVIRVVVGGLLAMAVTFGVGTLLGTTIGA